MVSRHILKFIGLSLLALPSIGSADSLNFLGVDQANVYQLNYNGQSEDVYVGSLNFSVNGSAPTETFCVDLDHLITAGQTYSVNTISTTTLPTSNAYRQAGDVLDAGIGTVTDANHAAAMQIAIWQTVYGNNFSLTGVSSTVQSEATAYELAGAKFSGAATYYQENSGCGQSQVAAVPEPCSMAIFGIGAVGAFIRRKKRS